MKRKRKKITLSEIRINIILLAVIFGVSVFLFFGRSLLIPSTVLSATASPEKPVERTLEKTIEKEPEKDVPVTAYPVTADTVKAVPLNAEPVPAAPSPLAAVTRSVPQVKNTPSAIKPPVIKTVPAIVTPSSPPPEKPFPVKTKGSLVFVFDDAGYNLAQLEPFLKLPFPCTIAVLPGLQYSKVAAARIRAAGKTVILHQPMQAVDLSINPGPGAIQKGMTAEQIKSLVRRNLDEIGPVAGINNHEGSLITADRQSMEALLDVVRERGIFFLDSRTNSETIVPTIAREKDMPIWERAVFLDNSQDRTLIIEAVNGGMKIAERKGAAIMIGHIWSNNLADILTKMYPELVSQGFSLSTIAQIAVNGDIDE